MGAVNEEPAISLLDVDGSETTSFRYEIEAAEPPSHALVSVASAITGTAPADLEPLGRHLDLEALDELLVSGDDETAFSASVVLAAEGLSLRIDAAEIVGAARRDVVGWSRGGP